MPPARILLVEDVRLHQALAQELLAARGHTVVVAGSAGEARAVLARERFDAVLVDLHLPDGGGEAVLEGLPRTLPVVAVSAQDETEARLRTRGFAGLIPKPLDTQRFAQQVEAFLPGAPAASAPRPASMRRGGLAAEMEALGPLLADLFATFARTLPGQLEQLGTLLAEARAHPADAARRERLQGLAHQLRGSCGTYGYDAVGDACAQMEEVLEAFGARPTGEMWAALEAMLAEARAALLAHAGA